MPDKQNMSQRKSGPSPNEPTLVNLASKLTYEQQKNIAREIILHYDQDVRSRIDWQDKRDRWYKLWTCHRDPKTSPWAGCSNVCVPFLLTASNQFHGRAYQSIFAPPGMVKAIPVTGNDVGRAKPVEDYLNWQTLYEMSEYEEEFDKLLINLPVNGTAFKKVYYDKHLNRNVSEYASAMNVVLPYRTKNLETARRISHELWLHYDEMQDRDHQKLYVNFDKVQQTAGKRDETMLSETRKIVTGESDHHSEDNPKLMLEVHCNYEFPWDDYRQPYIITVDYDSGTILRVTSRKIKMDGRDHTLNYFTDYHFFPNPEGFYSFGFGHFLENLNEMANTAFNQIFDAGSLSNMPFGFYGRRAGFKRREIKLEIGKMIEVEDASQVFFPTLQHVDQTLFMILGLIQQYSEQVSSNSDYLMGREAKGTKTPTAHGTLAIIEQGLVTFGVLTKRIFRQLRKELRLIFALNSLYLPESKQFRVLGSSNNLPFPEIKRTDFQGQYDVIPIGDPSFASRSTRKQEAMEFYQIYISNPLVGINPQTGQMGHPQGIWEVTSDLIDAFDKKNKAALLPEAPPVPMSPDAENALFMQGDYREPQVGENHSMHLESHIVFTSSPFYASMPDDYKRLHARHIEQTKALMFMEAQAKAAMGGNAPGQQAGPGEQSGQGPNGPGPQSEPEPQIAGGQIGGL
jgi:hypothetical protein